MERGHQERLAPLVRDLMGEAGLAFARIDRVAATVGPGSFTGLRVGVAFAKGLASALGLPTVAVNTLEALAAGRRGRVFAALDARRDQIYLQGFEDGAALGPPAVLATDEALARLAPGDRLVGSAAESLAAAKAGLVAEPAAYPDPARLARLAAGRPPSPLKPLYLRAPDARLPGGRLPEDAPVA